MHIRLMGKDIRSKAIIGFLSSIAPFEGKLSLVVSAASHVKVPTN